MARINTAPSAASSRYASATPTSTTSDQENRDPETRRRDKGKSRASDMPSQGSLPTPNSVDEQGNLRAQKRRRAQAPRSHGSPNGDTGDEEGKFNRYFDPNQDADERRKIKRKSRALEREFNENRDEILKNDDGRLAETVRKADAIFNGVKQTNDATLDSRLLVNVSDMAYRKANQLVLGDASTGVDVDEFLSKCITYMRNGGPAEVNEESAATRRRRNQNRHDSDDDSEDEPAGEPLDWELLGRHACVPYNSRPAVPSFLLGPLSVQKKQRTQTQRRARQTRETGREARPENLTSNDLNLSNENDLKAVCGRLHKDLLQHCERADDALSNAGITELDQLRSDKGRAVLREYRIAETGGPNLLEYALDPLDFGQTVENLFRISFLIKEGSCGVQPDDDGLPTLCVTQPRSLEEQRQNNVSKHQAIFSLDYPTWQLLVEAYGDREPLIPHRETEQQTQMGQRGWYN